jgi:hypothetical protein
LSGQPFHSQVRREIRAGGRLQRRPRHRNPRHRNAQRPAPGQSLPERRSDFPIAQQSGYLIAVVMPVPHHVVAEFTGEIGGGSDLSRDGSRVFQQKLPEGRRRAAGIRAREEGVASGGNVDAFEAVEAFDGRIKRRVARALVLNAERNEPMRFDLSGVDQLLRHRDDRGGIQPAAQLAQAGGFGRQPHRNCLAEERPQVLFVF